MTTTTPAVNEGQQFNNSLRVTWQVNPKVKVAGTYKADKWCNCPSEISATRAPEAARDRRFPRLRQEHAEMTSPITNRLLFETVVMHLFERWGNMHLQTKGLEVDPAMIAVLDQAANVPGLGVIANLNYRARGGAVTNNNSWNNNLHYRFNVSYITGAHAFKVGMNNAHGYHDNLTYQTNTLGYRFNNGVPNQITMRALPHTIKNHVDQDLGLFAQDKWTVNRLTVNAGLRYDYLASDYPDLEQPPGMFFPTARTFPGQTVVR